MPAMMAKIAIIARTTAASMRPAGRPPDALTELTSSSSETYRIPLCLRRSGPIGCCREPHGTTSRRRRRDSSRSVNINLSSAAAARAEEVAYHVLAQPLGHRAEHSPAVPPRHVLHERGEPVILGEHEDVQRRPAAGHLVHLGQGEFQGLP